MFIPGLGRVIRKTVTAAALANGCSKEEAKALGVGVSAVGFLLDPLHVIDTAAAGVDIIQTLAEEATDS